MAPHQTQRTHLVIQCDGLCEPKNPGGYACWAWIAFLDGKQVAKDHGCIGHGAGMTNNRAEYAAVIQALTWCSRHLERIHAKGLNVLIRTDSQLIVGQINGQWACRAAALKPLLEHAQALMAHTGATIDWAPRAQNEHADALSRVAYDEARAAHPSMEVQR